MVWAEAVRHLWIPCWILGFLGNLLVLVYSLGAIVAPSIGVALVSGLLFLGALLNLHFLARAVSRKHLEYLRRSRRVVLVSTIGTPLVLLLGCFDSGRVSPMEIALVAVVALFAAVSWWAIAFRSTPLTPPA